MLISHPSTEPIVDRAPREGATAPRHHTTALSMAREVALVCVVAACVVAILFVPPSGDRDLGPFPTLKSTR